MKREGENNGHPLSIKTRRGLPDGRGKYRFSTITDAGNGREGT